MSRLQDRYVDLVKCDLRNRPNKKYSNLSYSGEACLKKIEFFPLHDEAVMIGSVLLWDELWGEEFWQEMKISLPIVEVCG